MLSEINAKKQVHDIGDSKYNGRGSDKRFDYRSDFVQFEGIDIKKHRDTVIKFRKDSFIASFGDDSNFGEMDYLHWLEEKIVDFPKGFVLVKENEDYIGQLELSIREYEGKTIGYVNLYYLIPEKRGKGKGKKLHNYAKQFFENNNVNEYHLRVSPTNIAAMKFYRNNGMVEVGTEFEGKVIRMQGIV